MYIEKDIKVKIKVKQLEWKDEIIYDEDEGPIFSEAYGAGYWYIAEAVDCTLDEAKTARQREFEERILSSIIVEKTYE